MSYCNLTFDMMALVQVAQLLVIKRLMGNPSLTPKIRNLKIGYLIMTMVKHIAYIGSWAYIVMIELCEAFAWYATLVFCCRSNPCK